MAHWTFYLPRLKSKSMSLDKHTDEDLDGSNAEIGFRCTFPCIFVQWRIWNWSITPGRDSRLPVRCPDSGRGTQPRLWRAQRLGHGEEEEAAAGTSLWHGERTTFLSCTQSSHLPVRFRGQLTCCNSWYECQKWPEFIFGICQVLGCKLSMSSLLLVDWPCRSISD